MRTYDPKSVTVSLRGEVVIRDGDYVASFGDAPAPRHRPVTEAIAALEARLDAAPNRRARREILRAWQRAPTAPR